MFSKYIPNSIKIHLVTFILLFVFLNIFFYSTDDFTGIAVNVSRLLGSSIKIPEASNIIQYYLSKYTLGQLCISLFLTFIIYALHSVSIKIMSYFPFRYMVKNNKFKKIIERYESLEVSETAALYYGTKVYKYIIILVFLDCSAAVSFAMLWLLMLVGNNIFVICLSVYFLLFVGIAYLTYVRFIPIYLLEKRLRNEILSL